MTALIDLKILFMLCFDNKTDVIFITPTMRVLDYDICSVDLFTEGVFEKFFHLYLLVD